MIICKFHQFVNEKVGVAIPSLRYVDIIFDTVKENLIEFLNSDETILNKDVVIDDVFDVAFDDLQTYVKFPVVGIELNIDFSKTKDDKWSVGGAANPFGHKNWKKYSRISDSFIEDVNHGIILKIDINIDVNEGFKDVDLLDDDIRSTIWHECNHLYEKYNRFLNLGGSVLSRALKTALSWSDANRWGIKKEIFKFWNKHFLYYIYVSEPYEINARVQELGYFVIKYGFDSIKDNDNYKYARYLRDFNSGAFISDLQEEILKYYDEENVDYIFNRLKNMFISEYKKTLKENNETPTINLSKLEKMSFYEFVEFFEKRFNKSGDGFIRRISKLKTLDEKI